MTMATMAQNKIVTQKYNITLPQVKGMTENQVMHGYFLILRTLYRYPNIPISMMTTQIRPSLKDWKPILQAMIDDGTVVKTEQEVDFLSTQATPIYSLSPAAKEIAIQLATRKITAKTQQVEFATQTSTMDTAAAL